MSSFISRKRQEVAKKAFNYVKEVKDTHHDIEDKYASYVKKLPVNIKTNGLLAALSFEYAKSGENWRGDKSSKDKKAHGLLLSHIADYWGYDSNTALIEAMVNWDSLKVIRRTDEVISLLNWMRRFAEGMLKEAEE